MTPAIDSFYQYVKARVVAINSSRRFGGIMMAQDWPAPETQTESFYLLSLGEQPIGRQGYSAAIPILLYTLQWTWVIVGTDLTMELKGSNRGDRYRTLFTMKDELRKAMYPGFTEKKQIAISATGDITFSSLDPKEQIRWTPVSFKERVDKDSGTIYGTATTYLTDMSEKIAA